MFCEEDRTFRSNTIYKSDTPKKAPSQPSPQPKRAALQGARPVACPQPAAKKGFIARLFG